MGVYFLSTFILSCFCMDQNYKHASLTISLTVNMPIGFCDTPTPLSDIIPTILPSSPITATPEISSLLSNLAICLALSFIDSHYIPYFVSQCQEYSSLLIIYYYLPMDFSIHIFCKYPLLFYHIYEPWPSKDDVL